MHVTPHRHRPLPVGLRNWRGAGHGDRHGASLGQWFDDCSCRYSRVPVRLRIHDDAAAQSRLSFRRCAEGGARRRYCIDVVDNAIMLLIPGAVDAGLDNGLFWGNLAVALLIAGAAALPVNRWLIARGEGHAVIHQHHHH
jgi:hypothetical protein